MIDANGDIVCNTLLCPSRIPIDELAGRVCALEDVLSLAGWTVAGTPARHWCPGCSAASAAIRNWGG